METEGLGERAQSSMYHVREKLIIQSLVEDGELPYCLSKVLYCSQKHFSVGGFKINTRAWSWGCNIINISHHLPLCFCGEHSSFESSCGFSRRFLWLDISRQDLVGGWSAILLARVVRYTSLPLSQPHTTCCETGERWEAQLSNHHAVQILKLALKM